VFEYQNSVDWEKKFSLVPFRSQALHWETRLQAFCTLCQCQCSQHLRTKSICLLWL